MTLLDRTQAVLKADVDLTEMNCYLKSYIQHEIQKGIERQTRQEMEKIVPEIEKNVTSRMEEVVEQKIKAGGTGEKYTRWGRTTCSGDATLVYEGFAAGKLLYEGGSGANLLCLPKDPEWNKYTDTLEEWRGRLYGVEYEIVHNRPPYPGFDDKDMPCVVCLTDRRATVLMVPGKVTCHTGWHKEYSGYLMSEAGSNGRTSSEYICADENLESVPGGDANLNQAVVYPVESRCGSLKCPPYVNGRELTCVVCSK